jgi:glucuronosyltransferase
MKIFLFVFVLLALTAKIDGFKVLGVFAFGSKSHFAIGHGIVESLHKAGHDVTVISPYPQKNPNPNYRNISIAELIKKFEKGIHRHFEYVVTR